MIITPNCYLLPSVAITESNLVSGPPDAEAQVYDAGTTYDTGDLSWYGGNNWRSLVDGNIGNTPVEGANWTDLGAVDEGALAWTAGTYDTEEYAVNNHTLWRSATDGNAAEPLVSGQDNWVSYGPTNRHRIFDLFLNRFSILPSPISWKITIPERVTFALLFGPVGANVQIISRRPTTETIVYDKTFRLTRDSGGGFYQYAFSPIDQVSSVIIPDLGPYFGNTFEVIITGADDNLVGASQLIFGFAAPLGVTVTGASTGFESFNQVQFDVLGNPTFVTSPIRSTATFPLRGNILLNDRILNSLKRQANRPTAVFMRDGGPYGLVAYGILKDVTLIMPNSVLTETLIEIDGFAEGSPE